MEEKSKSWPAFNPERRDPSTLLAFKNNARTHSDAQIEQIVRSLQEFGWTMPILVDEDDQIIAGHGRALAAERIPLPSVPVVVARGWTEAQKRAYVLADNQLALNAGWDENLLRVEFAGLQELGYDTSVIGFGDEFIANLFALPVGFTDPEHAPKPPEIPASRPGDVWLLGGHRLVCGDSCSEASVASCLGQDKPHLMTTDPPYGVEYDASWRAVVNHDGPNSKRAVGKVSNDERSDWREAWALFPGDVAYIWHAGTKCGIVNNSLSAVGFNIRAQIIWVKPRQVFGRGNYHEQKEPCFYAVREGADDRWEEDHETLAYAVRADKAAGWVGGRKQTTVWEIEHVKSETGHSTQKPVECMRRPMENNSKAGDAVYEPFCGSGTTIIAGEMIGRRVLAIELDPVYVDVSVIRWQEFTGNIATLQATGQTFGEVRDARVPHDASV